MQQIGTSFPRDNVELKVGYFSAAHIINTFQLIPQIKKNLPINILFCSQTRFTLPNALCASCLFRRIAIGTLLIHTKCVSPVTYTLFQLLKLKIHNVTVYSLYLPIRCTIIHNLKQQINHKHNLTMIQFIYIMVLISFECFLSNVMIKQLTKCFIKKNICLYASLNVLLMNL